MEDEDLIDLNDYCSDLVGSKRWEAFPMQLLKGKPVAEWVRVRDFCLEAGLHVGDCKSDLFASWLPDPTGAEEYALILFYDEESMWTMAARYNRRRTREALPTRTADSGAYRAFEQAPPTHSG